MEDANPRDKDASSQQRQEAASKSETATLHLPPEDGKCSPAEEFSATDSNIHPSLLQAAGKLPGPDVNVIVVQSKAKEPANARGQQFATGATNAKEATLTHEQDKSGSGQFSPELKPSLGVKLTQEESKKPTEAGTDRLMLPRVLPDGSHSPRSPRFGRRPTLTDANKLPKYKASEGDDNLR